MPEREHDDHGKTPAAWTGVCIWCVTAVVAAFVLIFWSVIACIVAIVVGTLLGAVVWKVMAGAARRRKGAVAEQQVDEPATSVVTPERP
jgi:hypothetical protein